MPLQRMVLLVVLGSAAAWPANAPAQTIPPLTTPPLSSYAGPQPPGIPGSQGYQPPPFSYTGLFPWSGTSRSMPPVRQDFYFIPGRDSGAGRAARPATSVLAEVVLPNPEAV